MSNRSLREAASQIIALGFPAGEPPRAVIDAARRNELGGVVLFKRNLPSAEEAADLIATLTDEVPVDRPLLVAVDQEGGRVARLGPPVLRLPPMRVLGSIDDPELTQRAARVLGEQLRAIGFTMDFAPVLDVDTNPENPVIGDRSFSRGPTEVARHGRAFAEGLAAAGVLSCAKHFPGHGDTTSDSHFTLPRLTHARERLDAIELHPFRALLHQLPAIMTAHVVFEQLDRARPATLSPSVVEGLLKGELAYDGVVISDDLEMKAVADSPGPIEAASQAVAAGCDLLLFCSDVELAFAARDALIRRAESDSSFASRVEDASSRCLRMKRLTPPKPLRGSALREALESRAARELEEEIARLALAHDRP